MLRFGQSGLGLDNFVKVWTIKVEVVSLQNEYERRKWREKLGEVLAEKTLYITEVKRDKDIKR